MASLKKSHEVTSDSLSHDAPPVQGAYFALAVLFSMNLLNYVDRYVFYSVGEPISRELGFSDFDFGKLSVAFMAVYTVVSPAMGYLGDRGNRTRLLAFGVGLWSLATVGTAFAGRLFGQNYYEMFFWRALLGVGEASYGVIAPTLLADLFQPRLRGRVLGLFCLALPVGGAIGYILGGWVGSHLGWRAAFLVVGLPGLVAAGAAFLIRDPGRGASEGPPISSEVPAPGPSAFLAFFRNPTFVLNTLGMTAVTFATGAYAVWGATFYQRVHNLGVKEAGQWIGGLTLTAGLVGIGLGMWLPDLLRKHTPRAYLSWAGLAVTLAAPFALLGLLSSNTQVSLALVFVAMVLLASVLGPCNTVTADVVPAHRRAAGFALNIFLLHALGDIVSPPLIGWVSVGLGADVDADWAITRFLNDIGHGAIAMPDGTYTNLTLGMLCVVPMLSLGGVFFLFGSRFLQRDQAKARLASRGTEMEPVMLH